MTNLHEADNPRSRRAAPFQESPLSDVKGNRANELERGTAPEDQGETEMFCAADAIIETRRVPIKCSTCHVASCEAAFSAAKSQGLRRLGQRLRLQPNVCVGLFDLRPLRNGNDDLELRGAADRAALHVDKKKRRVVHTRARPCRIAERD